MNEDSLGAVLVTGASSGIGRAVCKKLLEQGYPVSGLSRTHDKSLSGQGGYTALDCDLSDLAGTEKIIKSYIKSEKRLNAVVFCAGAGYFGALEQLSFKKMQALIELNLLSPMLISKLMVPGFKKARAGRLIFLGSEAALHGSKNGTAYCASKFGLRGFVQSLSAECRQAGVNVSLINPGMVDTPFFDKLPFKPGHHPSNYIRASTVAEYVYSVLKTDSNAVIEEINLSPRNRVIFFN